MKVLFIAANPDDAASLNLVREITELQSRLPVTSGQPVSFIFLPDTKVEDLRGDEQLSLKNEAGVVINLDAAALKAFMPWDCPPRLVYVSACNSLRIAAASLKSEPAETDWPRQHQWLASTMKKLRDAIEPFIANLASLSETD